MTADIKSYKTEDFEIVSGRAEILRARIDSVDCLLAYGAEADLRVRFHFVRAAQTHPCETASPHVRFVSCESRASYNGYYLSFPS